MVYRKSLPLLIVCLCFLPAALLAQQEVELDPVTVTATLQPLSVSQTGRNMVVIEGARFQSLPVQSIDELLRYVPGLEVQARGPMGSQSDLVLRGGTFQQVLVVLDGLRLNDPITGHFSSYIPIAPAEIERIEILKGASSALYGSDAVGGVVHIITKTFAAKSSMDKRKSLGASVMGGEWSLLHANAGGYYKSGKTAVAGGFLTNNSNGQPLRGTRGFFNIHTASLSINQVLSEQWQVSLRSAWDSRRFGAQNFYTVSPADSADEKVTSFWNQLQLRYNRGKNKFSLQGGFKKVEDEFRFNPKSLPNNNRSTLYQALALYEHNFFKTSYLTTGIQFQNRLIRSNDRGNHSVKQAALFTVLQQRIGTALNLTPALRLDWDERSGTELIPQVNVSYKLAEFQLRGSAGKTIRQADFTERYNNYNKPLIPNLNRVGNPGLKAETSFSYEAGIDLFAGKNIKIAATYFQRDHKDLIDFTSTPYSQMPRQQNLSPDGTYFLAKNIANVLTTGVETDIQFLQSFEGSRQLLLNAGFVFLNSEAGNTAPSLYIASHANFLTNFNVTYTTPGWTLGINGLYKDRKKQAAPAIKADVSKDYFVLHARAEAFIIKRKLSLLLQVDNLFNRTYSDLLGAQMPQRWLMGGARFAL